MSNHSPDRPAREIEITEDMIAAGVAALAKLCPLDVAFPVGGEGTAVAAVLLAGLQVQDS